MRVSFTQMVASLLPPCVQLGFVGIDGASLGVAMTVDRASDVFDIMKAVFSGSVAFFVVIYVILGLTDFPRSVFVLETLLTAGLLAGVRLISRATADSSCQDSRVSKKVAIIGAGFAAEMILREIRHYDAGYAAVACFDDNPSKLGLKIIGVPVLGSIDRMPEILEEKPVDEIFIAIPSATASQMQRFVDACERSGVKFRTVPALHELIAGRSAFAQLRDVNLDDLLGREPVTIDLKSVREQIADQTVIVTGAAGSIGSELCRQILEYGPRKLICLDQSETGIFYLQNELAIFGDDSNKTFYIADVGHRERMFSILREHRPNLILHAAAYKHVSLLEENVREAVTNNIFGLLNLIEAAEASGCRTFLLISSDKAVRPTSVMGATKRACELILSCRPTGGMRCVSVRFGNVLGSSGSVVPILQQKLRRNEALTITHPEITRFFMTSHEAVSLVLQAIAIGENGDILVLDMSRPVRILDLAHSLIRLSGKSADDVKIRFTGLRPGEKLFEELYYASEDITETSCPKIRRICGSIAEWSKLHCKIEELRASLSIDGAAPIRAQLKKIVPEYFYPPVFPAHSVPDKQDAPPRALARAAGRG